MEKIQMENYLQDIPNNYYCSPIIIIKILEDILGKPINEIINDINNTKIIVTENEIREFLDNTFAEREPEVKHRIENPKPKKEFDPTKWAQDSAEKSTRAFMDQLTADEYRFEPYTLKYFNNYTKILKTKILTLLNLIEKIGTKKTRSIKKELIELDIILSKDDNILKMDIIRLIQPTVYNIQKLNEKVTEANNLSTYLSFKMSKYSLAREGFSESEIYPHKSLQVKNLSFGNLPGDVRLSNNQKQQLREEQDKNIKSVAKILLHLK